MSLWLINKNTLLDKAKLEDVTLLRWFDIDESTTIFLIEEEKEAKVVQVGNHKVYVRGIFFDYGLASAYFKDLYQQYWGIKMDKEQPTMNSKQFEPTQDLWDMQPKSLKFCQVIIDTNSGCIRKVGFYCDKPMSHGLYPSTCKVFVYKRPLPLEQGAWYAFISESGGRLMGIYDSSVGAIRCGKNKHFPHNIEITKRIDPSVWEK